MDAVEFLKAAERRSVFDPIYYGEFINLRGNDFVTFVAQVEQWTKEHPVKTRQSEFLKMYPNAKIDDDGILYMGPCMLDTVGYDDKRECVKQCNDCRREYWLQEIWEELNEL